MFIAGKNAVVTSCPGLLLKHVQAIRLEKFKYQLPETLISEHDFCRHISQKTRILDFVPEHTLRRIYSHLSTQPVHWQAIPWVNREWLFEGALEKEFYIYATDVEDYKLYLRLNDFPEEPLYTIVYDDIELFHVNTFGRKWTSDPKKTEVAKDSQQ